MEQPARKGDYIRPVGILFSGGPAPAANAVISSAAISFLDDGREAIGFLHGYDGLQHYHPTDRPLVAGEDYRMFAPSDVSGILNTQGVIIGTSRA